MIKIIVYKKNNYIKKIIVKGHAGFADHGQDIVCAGVSALTYTLINSMKHILGVDGIYRVYKGDASYALPDNLNDEVQAKCQLVFETIVLGYKNMRDSYKSYVEVFEEEV